MNKKPGTAKKKNEITWTGYKCKVCGSSGSSPGSLPFVKCPFCQNSDIEEFDSSTKTGVPESFRLEKRIEKFDSSTKNRKAYGSIEIEEMYKCKRYFKRVEMGICELEGPYECPCCEGHIMLDATFLDQVSTIVSCPYCSNTIYVKDIE